MCIRSVASVAVAAVLVCLSSGVPSGAGAQLAARPAEAWIKTLDAPARIAGLKVEEIVASLRLKPGDVVADLGAGTGVFSIPMARRVGPAGKVYAVEIEQGLVDHIARRATEDRVANLHAVLGRFTDPALPDSGVDLAFMHDVLHHVERREEYLKNAVKYLKTDARFAFVEFHHALGPHRHDPALGVSHAQLDEWMGRLGFARADTFPLFEDRYFVVYARAR